MQGAYGGLVIILLYGTGERTVGQELEIITQDNQNIQTQSSEDLLAQE